jgi:hypothetical protein
MQFVGLSQVIEVFNCPVERSLFAPALMPPVIEAPQFSHRPFNVPAFMAIHSAVGTACDADKIAENSPDNILVSVAAVPPVAAIGAPPFIIAFPVDPAAPIVRIVWIVPENLSWRCGTQQQKTNACR